MYVQHSEMYVQYSDMYVWMVIKCEDQ